MKYIDEFRNPALAQKILAEIESVTTKDWVIMEVCGGQTHALIKNGIDQLLPDKIELVRRYASCTGIRQRSFYN